jgi:hypothetical protein
MKELTDGWEGKELMRLIETGRDYEPGLAKQLLATMRREAKLIHAIAMLESEVLSPKQRRRIIAEARSEYSDGKVKE